MLPGVSLTQETKRPGSAAEREEVGPGDIVRIDTDLVPVEVTVRNASGQAVRGLNVSDFKLFPDEVRQPISFFASETVRGRQAELDLIFALDVSGSMTHREMELLKEPQQLSRTISQFSIQGLPSFRSA